MFKEKIYVITKIKKESGVSQESTSMYMEVSSAFPDLVQIKVYKNHVPLPGVSEISESKLNKCVDIHIRKIF
jgi:hypothetical protein